MEKWDAKKNAKWQLVQRLTEDYLSENYRTQRELAIRHGVSEGTICQYLKIVRQLIREETEEFVAEETTKRLSQLRRMIGKANQSFELSKRDVVETHTRLEKKFCSRCDGKGKKDGIECGRCGGEGFWLEEAVTEKRVGQAGDPRFLAVALKGIQEICRIEDLYPEKRGTRIGRQYNIAGTLVEESDLSNAPVEILLKLKGQMLQALSDIERSKNGQKVLEVEFEEKNDDD